MEGTGITPVMDMNHGYGDYGFGGGSGIWLFAILALMWGGNGFFGGNGLGYRPATAEDVSSGFNFSELQSENRDILSAISSDTASTIAAVERVGSGLTGDIHNVALGVADTTSAAKQYGIKFADFNEYDWNYAMNMVYSDYYGTVPDDVSAYVKLADKFINDKDAGVGKAFRYYVAMNYEDLY